MKLSVILLILGLLAFLAASFGGYLYYSALKNSVISEVESSVWYFRKKVKKN